jgi:hypothetical protein
MITLHQAFYGRVQTGYRLLASSCPEFNQRIEQLCTAIGTPDGTSVVEPFFLNYIEGNNRFMIQCCIGNQDDAGRKTLFFHILVGNHSQLKQSRMGIASLIRNKLFESKLPSGPILDVSLEEDSYSLPWGNKSLVWNNDKLAIISNKPELNLLTGTLKGNIDNISWASFSFHPLDSFTIYVISEYVPRPTDRKTVATDGTVAAIPQKQQKPIQAGIPKTSVSVNKEKSKQPSGIKSIILVLSLIANIVLGYLLIQPRNVQQTQTEPKTDIKPIEQKDDNNSPAKVTREEIVLELRQSFLQKYQIIEGSWEELMRSDPKLERDYFELKKRPLQLAKGYVQFLNEEILQNSEAKNGK